MWKNPLVKKMKEKITIRPDFLIIPGPVAFSDKLQALDQKLYGVIYWLFSLKDGICLASNLYLARVCYPNEENKEKLKTKARCIQNSLARLEKEGFILRKYKDKLKKIRGEIIPLVSYQKVSSINDTVSSPDDTRVSSADDHISKRGISKSRPVASATDGQKNDSGDKKDRPMNLQQFVEWCGKGNQAHIKIIGEWAETTKPQLETVEQWESYIKRHLRPARSLVPFSHEQLEAGFQRIKDAKYLDTVTLETLYKFITNAKIK